MKKNSHWTDHGFTQVSVLLGVVLATSIVLMFSLSPRKMGKAARSSERDLALQEALHDALSLFVRTKVVHGSVPCADPEAYFRSHLYFRTMTASVGQLRTAPPAGIDPAAWDQVFQKSMAANGFAGSALGRCSLSVLGTAGRFHFCVQVQRNEEASAESFLRDPLIFAEISIQLLDLKSSHNLSCAQYLDPRRKNAGATVESALFVVRENDEDLDVSRSQKQFFIRR